MEKNGNEFENWMQGKPLFDNTQPHTNTLDQADLLGQALFKTPYNTCWTYQKTYIRLWIKKMQGA